MKDLYELLNDINIDENEFEEMKVNDIEKVKLKKNLRKNVKKRSNWKKKSIAVASVLIVSTATFGIAFPSYAKDTPIVGDIFRFLDNGKTGVYDKFKENANEINLTKVSNGISITLNDVIFNGRTLTLTYTLKSDRDLGDNIAFFGDVDIKGFKNLTGSGGSKFVKTSENTYIGKEEFTFSKFIEEPVNQINFKVRFNEIILENNNENIKGNWNFDVSNLKAIKGEKIDVNANLKKDGITLNINEISLDPTSTFISYSQRVSENINKNWQRVETNIEVKDDLGNVYSSEDNGGYGESKNNINWSKNFEKIKEEATKLIITPKVELINGLKGGGVEFDKDGNERPIVNENKKEEKKEIIFDEIVVDLKK